MEVDNSVAEDEIVYYKEKLLIDLLRDISTNKSNLSESLKEKLGKVLADVDLSLYMSLHKANDIDHRTSNIFGLAPIKIEEFTYTEQKCLQSELESRILEKYPKLLETYSEITNGMIEKSQNVSKTHNNLRNEQQKLLELSSTYISKLHRSTELHAATCAAMREWTDMRLGVVVGKAEESVQLYDIKNKFLELKARIIDVQLSLHVYSQNNSVMSYMEINKDITKKIDKLRDEIASCRKILEDGL